MRVWIIQTGELLPYLHPEARPMRASNVVRALRDAGHEVVLWTSDFIHQSHEHLFGRNTILRPEPGIELRLIHSAGYSRNIGLGRVYDHTQFAKRLLSLMKREPLPDVAFVGFPPMEAAAVSVNRLRRHGVPTLLDVKDQWPEVFVRPIPDAFRLAGEAAIWPYQRLVKQTMRRSTALSAISPGFLDWALSVAGRSQNEFDLVLPLTSRGCDPDVSQANAASQWWDSQGVPDDGRFRIAYVGSISTGIDVDDMIDAASTVQFQFVICGDGPQLEHLRRRTEHLSNVVCPGWVDQAQGEVLYGRSSVTLAPYIDEAAFGIGIPNKIYDSLRHGLPVVTNASGALGTLVTAHDVGIHYETEDSMGLAAHLNLLAEHPQLLASMKKNARALYIQEFTFERVYGGLVRHLETLADIGQIEKQARNV